jgi:hypothetical protein
MVAVMPSVKVRSYLGVGQSFWQGN